VTALQLIPSAGFLRRTGAMLIKEFIQLRRDRLSFAMIVMIPIMQLLLFGFAINLDIRHIDAAIVDQAQTARSREVAAALDATGLLALQDVPAETPAQLIDALRQGRISVGIVLPPDLDRRLELRDRPAVQVMVDGSDQTVQAAARQLAALPMPGAKPAYQGVEVVNFYNPERRAPVNTVPGLIGLILTMTLVMFTGMALVRERERGNLEMLIATPVSPWEITIGKVLPFVGIGLVQVTVVLLLGKWVFDVPVRGLLVEVYAKRLQIQEKMTAQIANTLDEVLKPKGVAVVIEASHQCMTTRGVHKPGVSMVTSRMLGVFRTDPSTRREVLSMIGTPSGGTGEYV